MCILQYLKFLSELLFITDFILGLIFDFCRFGALGLGTSGIQGCYGISTIFNCCIIQNRCLFVLCCCRSLIGSEFQNSLLKLFNCLSFLTQNFFESLNLIYQALLQILIDLFCLCELLNRFSCRLQISEFVFTLHVGALVMQYLFEAPICWVWAVILWWRWVKFFHSRGKWVVDLAALLQTWSLLFRSRAVILVCVIV